MLADERGESVTPIREFGRNSGWIWDVAFVEDQESFFFTCSSNTQVICWNLNDLQQSNEITGHTRAVVCIAVRERTVGKEGEQMVANIVHSLANGAQVNGPTDHQQLEYGTQLGSSDPPPPG